MKRAIASLCAVGLVLAAPGAHAGTRAAASTVSLMQDGASGGPLIGLAESVDGQGCRDTDDPSKKSKRCKIIVWLAGSAWLLAFLHDINRMQRFAFMPEEGVQPERDSSFGTGG